jgi:tetratricopeptide (TPR) repeat protein/SAM-dependent methyltransferase
MNRKQRRSARHQAQPDRLLARTEGQQLFEAALRYQKAGQVAEAARLYDRILATEPRHMDSLQNLGVIAMKAGRLDMAIDLLRRALAVSDRSVELHCNLAVALHAKERDEEAIVHCRRVLAIKADHAGAHMVLAKVLHRQGKREEAIACYRRVLAGMPEHVQTHTDLAVALTQQGQFDDARHHFERALALEPNDARTHFGYGNLYLEQGEVVRAIDCYLRAMEIQPDDMKAHYNFCAALMSLSKFDAVAEYYEQFLTIKPDFVPGYNHLASAYNAAGNAARALDVARRGLAIVESQQGKSIFAQCLRNLETVPAEDLRDLIVRAVSEPWIRPMSLAPQCLALIQANAEVAACIARAVAAWPAFLPAEQLFGPSGLVAMSQDEVLRVYLENSRVVTLEMEQLLTAVRFTLLEQAASARDDTELDEPALAFYCALARQCFITEYAFLDTEQEIAQVNALRDAVDAALRANAPIPPIRLAAVAAYRSLQSLAEHDRLLARSWPQPIEDLLTQQVREPAEERRLRDTIPALTPIEDDVSIAVRSQYEESPYPRWVEAPTVDVPLPINRRLRGAFPLAEFAHVRTDGAVDLLVAGCGTGQSLVDYANRFAGTRTLAVDLSLTSLAYAKRKIQALGLRNIEFGQADILKLGSLGRTFDIINCGGVLHHLADPEAGWRVLLSLLKPNGLMSVALYSELARTHYVAAQELIAERGYGRSPDEIRRFRRDLIAGESSEMRDGVLDCPDFFSLSECRDLLFHVQEHRTTIPQLKAFFEQHDLRFIGFDVQQVVRQAYAQYFPEDPAFTNLDNWHVFEQANPWLFLSMYQFWVQKGRTAT